MDGGWKSITTGLASYKCLSAHHTGETLQNTRSLMGHREHSALHTSIWRLGKVLRDNGPKLFQVETTLNTAMFPEQFSFIASREWEWSARERATYLATTTALSRTCQTAQGPELATCANPGCAAASSAGGPPCVR